MENVAPMASRAVVSFSLFTFSLFAALVVVQPACAGDGSLVPRFDALEQGFNRAKGAVAQIYGGRPPADLDEEPAPAGGREAAALGLRIERLERDMRHMTGRIEELQHDILRLEDQLRAAKTDASAIPPRPAVPAPVATAAAATVTAPVAVQAQNGLRRSDAFDPAANPTAPGAPQPLGAAAPSAPLSTPLASPAAARPAGSVAAAREPGQPLDLTHGRAAAEPAPGVAAIDAAPPPAQGPRDDYEKALALLRSGQYEAAEKGFADFLAKNPKNKLVAGATFNLGESYFLRGRNREAAEKYLEIKTKYAQSALAPEAMLRLGQSLNAIGAKEQACASYGEIGVNYPTAAQKIRDAADRESKKLQC
jgi:tol-pal system protein YbgF